MRSATLTADSARHLLSHTNQSFGSGSGLIDRPSFASCYFICFPAMPRTSHSFHRSRSPVQRVDGPVIVLTEEDHAHVEDSQEVEDDWPVAAHLFVMMNEAIVLGMNSSELSVKVEMWRANLEGRQTPEASQSWQSQSPSSQSSGSQ